MGYIEIKNPSLFLPDAQYRTAALENPLFGKDVTPDELLRRFYAYTLIGRRVFNVIFSEVEEKPGLHEVRDAIFCMDTAQLCLARHPEAQNTGFQLARISHFLHIAKLEHYLRRYPSTDTSRAKVAFSEGATILRNIIVSEPQNYNALRLQDAYIREEKLLFPKEKSIVEIHKNITEAVSKGEVIKALRLLSAFLHHSQTVTQLENTQSEQEALHIFVAIFQGYQFPKLAAECIRKGKNTDAALILSYVLHEPLGWDDNDYVDPALHTETQELITMCQFLEGKSKIIAPDSEEQANQVENKHGSPLWQEMIDPIYVQIFLKARANKNQMVLDRIRHKIKYFVGETTYIRHDVKPR